MAKEKLKRMGRFELLQLIYQLKKSNEELTLRCREGEKQIDTLKREGSEREDKLRRDYERRIDEIRMQGSAKDLQQRMKKLEQQLLSFQFLAEQESSETAKEPSIPIMGTDKLQESEKNISQKDGE